MTDSDKEEETFAAPVLTDEEISAKLAVLAGSHLGLDKATE